MLPIRFKPFVGKNYSNEQFKILVLGESHYLNSKDLLDFKSGHQRIEHITNNVLNSFLNYKRTRKSYARWMNTFTKFSNVYHGKRLTPKNTVDFWDSCSFYNYVQAPTAGPRVSPKTNEFQQSFEALEKVIEDIRPDIIYIWGYRLWDNLPIAHIRNEKVDEFNLYYLGVNKIPIMKLPHPSSTKFNYKLSTQLKRYTEKVKKNDLSPSENIN